MLWIGKTPFGVLAFLLLTSSASAQVRPRAKYAEPCSIPVFRGSYSVNYYDEG
jgi:hypothetical protein